ncbi:hypothetical protein H2203_003911 [Taxawa tesnikishii (nom. ined.)]|nr:hypothetical protein H2203_003911 [Dothideales sp. JES 119]
MHALIAMGSLHQATLQALGRSETRTDTPAFALRHINNSIRAVTDPEPNLHKLLSICAIYSTFEAMQGRSNDAISHILQGQKLLALMSGATQEPNALPIHTLNVVHITTQLGSIAYGMTEVPAPFQMPEPTPIPATFPSIEKADCCLRYARSAILTLCLCIYARESSPQALVALEQKQSVYAPYLLRWETSFAKLLAGNGAKLADFDRKRAMILKANHLHLSVLASVDNRQGLRAYRPFERHYRAIVELSKAVLGAWGTLPLPTVAPFERPWISYGMWLTEPLYTVMTRSHGVELQEEARRLLQRHPPQQAILGLAPDAHDKGSSMVDEGPLVGRHKNPKGEVCEIPRRGWSQNTLSYAIPMPWSGKAPRAV